MSLGKVTGQKKVVILCYLIHRDLELEILFDSPLLLQFPKFNHFLWVCWFLAQNFPNFVSLSWKLHNWYCHTFHSLTIPDLKTSFEILIESLEYFFQNITFFFKHTFVKGVWYSAVWPFFGEWFSVPLANNLANGQFHIPFEYNFSFIKIFV